MQITKVLARKDAFSLVTAIVVALAASNFLQSISITWSTKLVINNSFQQISFGGEPSDWKGQYLVPILTFVISLILLEFFLLVMSYASSSSKKSK